MDGESWCDDTDVINTTSTLRGDDFDNWSIWKQKNKAGVDCELSLSFVGNTIYMEVENSDLATVNQTKLPEKVDKGYCYLTGDQCAITNIRVTRD